MAIATQKHSCIETLGFQNRLNIHHMHRVLFHLDQFFNSEFVDWADLSHNLSFHFHLHLAFYSHLALRIKVCFDC